MDPMIYTIKFTVKGHDVNSQKFMTIPSLLRNMQEASLQHARSLKTSVWDMTEDKLTWVLVRKEIKIVTPLAMDKTYTILTYPSGFDKFFAFRDFLIFDEEKKLVVGASSTWTLLQTDTRRLIKIPEKILKIGAPKNTRFLPHAAKKLTPPTDTDTVGYRKVRPYDMDWNNHVNNIVLIRFMMESLKHQGIEDHEVHKILVHFKNELRIDEEVRIVEGVEGNIRYSKLEESVQNKEIASSLITLR